MSWQALGGDPVPGDPSAVRTVAAAFGSVEERAGSVAHRLESLAAGVGPHIWKGPAASGFRELLGRLQPGLTQLATAHSTASGALYDFASVLEDAQSAAAGAETAAEDAIRRGRQAEGDRDGAATAAATQAGIRRQAQVHLAEAHVLELNPLADPAYIAELKRYEQGVLTQMSVASSREHDALEQQKVAQVRADDAVNHLKDALRASRGATDERNAAARTAVLRLQGAMASGSSGAFGVLQTIVKILDLPDGLHGVTRGVAPTGRYDKQWEFLLRLAGKDSRLAKLLRYKPVINKFNKFMSVPGVRTAGKFIGPIAFLMSIPEMLDDAYKLRQDLQAHDGWGAASDALHLSGTVLKTFGPVGYVIGVGASEASDIIGEARQIDWHDLPSFAEMVKYGPESAAEAVGTIPGKVFEWLT